MPWAEAAAIPTSSSPRTTALVTNAAARPGESVMVTAGPRASHGGDPDRAPHRCEPRAGDHPDPGQGAALRALGAHEAIDTRDAGKWVDR